MSANFGAIPTGTVVNLETFLRASFTAEDDTTAEEDIKFIILSVEFALTDEEVLPYQVNTNLFMFTQTGSHRIIFVVEDEFGNRSVPVQASVIVG